MVLYYKVARHFLVFDIFILIDEAITALDANVDHLGIKF
jgi:hypothetical protein